MRNACHHILLALLAISGNAIADSGLRLQLARDIKFNKPAELIYVNSSGESATIAANAALQISTNLRALSADGVTTDVGLIASVARNTLSTKPVHKWGATAELRSQIRAAQNRDPQGNSYNDTLTLFGTVTHESDRIAAESGTLYRLGATLNSNRLLRFSTSETGSTRAALKLFPTVGVYQRSFANATATPAGTTGGPFVAVLAKGSLGSVMDLTWFERVGLEASAQIARPSWGSAVTGGRSSVKLFDAGISYNLASSDSAWQPSISITRTIGADPILDEARRVQTVIAFRVGYNR
jgi:hypothetical protein